MATVLIVEEINTQSLNDYLRFLCWIRYLVSDLNAPKNNLTFLFSSVLEYISKTYTDVVSYLLFFSIIIVLYLVGMEEGYR